MLYTVTLYANAERVDIPGYHQWAEATHAGEWRATWSYVPTPGKLRQPKCKHVIMERFVVADTATGALIRFNNWRGNGYPDTYLMEDK